MSTDQRPYARKIAGVPRATRFDMESMSFEFTFENDSSIRPDGLATEIFVPKDRYPRESTRIEISDGSFVWNFEVRRP